MRKCYQCFDPTDDRMTFIARYHGRVVVAGRDGRRDTVTLVRGEVWRPKAIEEVVQVLFIEYDPLANALIDALRKGDAAARLAYRDLLEEQNRLAELLYHPL